MGGGGGKIGKHTKGSCFSTVNDASQAENKLFSDTCKFVVGVAFMRKWPQGLGMLSVVTESGAFGLRELICSR